MASIIAAAVVFMLGWLGIRIMLFRRRKIFKSLKEKHVVITGGSSGIGFAIAKLCLREGAFVTLIARNEINLLKARNRLVETIELASDRILLKIADVGDPTAVTPAIQDSSRWRPIDILICNAGVAKSGLFDSMPIHELELVARTNFMGCVYPVRAALPLMKRRGPATPTSVVFMSSLSSLVFVYGMNLYTPAKYAQRGLAELLRMELMPHNIHVSLVCPGFTETPMLDEADKFSSTSNKLGKTCFYNRERASDADSVAALAMEGVKRGEFLITTELGGFLLGILGRGNIPAESFTRAVLELVLLVPMRLLSFIVFAYLKRVLKPGAGAGAGDGGGDVKMVVVKPVVPGGGEAETLLNSHVAS